MSYLRRYCPACRAVTWHDRVWTWLRTGGFRRTAECGPCRDRSVREAAQRELAARHSPKPDRAPESRPGRF